MAQERLGLPEIAIDHQAGNAFDLGIDRVAGRTGEEHFPPRRGKAGAHPPTWRRHRGGPGHGGFAGRAAILESPDTGNRFRYDRRWTNGRSHWRSNSMRK